jgi:hypothetical protein
MRDSLGLANSFLKNGDFAGASLGGLAWRLLSHMAFAVASFQARRVGGGSMAFQEILFVNADEFIADGYNLSGMGDGPSYLIHSDDESGLVGLYARHLEGQARDLETLMRSADPNARDVCARLRN